MISFDKKVIPNIDYVAVRLVDYNTHMNVGGIVLSEAAYANDKLALGKIESIGSKAKKDFGLDVGDYVMFDRLATAYQTKPVMLIEYHNIIVKCDEHGGNYSPLRNMIFVESDNTTAQKVNGIYLTNKDKQLRTGKIIAMNLDKDSDEPSVADFPFDIGDKILVTQHNDDIQVGEKHIHVFKPHQVVCKIVED